MVLQVHFLQEIFLSVWTRKHQMVLCLENSGEKNKQKNSLPQNAGALQAWPQPKVLLREEKPNKSPQGHQNFTRDSYKPSSFSICSKLGKIILKHDTVLHGEPGLLWGPAGNQFPFFSHRSLQRNVRDANRDQHQLYTQKCSASSNECMEIEKRNILSNTRESQLFSLAILRRGQNSFETTVISFIHPMDYFPLDK